MMPEVINFLEIIHNILILMSVKIFSEWWFLQITQSSPQPLCRSIMKVFEPYRTDDQLKYPYTEYHVQ